MFKILFFTLLLLVSQGLYAKHNSKTVKEHSMPVTELHEKGYELGEVNNRIKVRAVNNWRQLNSQYVLVEGKSKKNSKLIKFKRQCARSKGAAFAYDVRGGTLTNLDIIKVVDYPYGVRKVCVIDKIYQLNFIGKPSKDKEETGAAS